MLYSSINFICAFILIAFFSNFFIGLLYPLWRKIFNFRSNHIFTLSLLPLIISAFSCLLIILKANIFSFSSHCHGNNCEAHIPHININQTGNQVLIILLASLAIGYFFIAIYRNRINSQKIQNLQKISQLMDENIQILETTEPIAFSSGLLKPKTFISTGLITLLSKEQLNAVVLHEQAHNLYKDNLRKNIIFWLSQLWLNPNKKLIRKDFYLACEYHSDSYAAYNQNAKKSLLAAIDKINQLKKSDVYIKRITRLNSVEKTQNPLTINGFYIGLSIFLLITLSTFYHYIAELIFN